MDELFDIESKLFEKREAPGYRSPRLSHRSDLKDVASRGKFRLCTGFSTEILLNSDQELSHAEAPCTGARDFPVPAGEESGPVCPASTSLTQSSNLDRSDIDTSAASNEGSSVPQRSAPACTTSQPAESSNG
jgi:hypothetical protein